MEDLLKLEQEKNALLEAAILEKDATIAQLEKQIADAPTATASVSTLPKFKVDKAEYQFIVGGFSHEGIDYTASEAAKDKTLCAELVKGEYGVIVKL